MPTGSATKPLREGSAEKRAAILSAAQELFLTVGFDRTSVDAVAASAGVSKRTVYDYFGDKRSLVLAVVDSVAQTLLVDLRAAIADHLVDVDDLEAALIAFSSRVATSTLGSSDYAALMRLTAHKGLGFDVRGHLLSRAPEELLIERFDEFVRRGLLEERDTSLAVDHFIAMTLLPVAEHLRVLAADDPVASQHKINEGVRAFLRAYAPR